MTDASKISGLELVDRLQVEILLRETALRNLSVAMQRDWLEQRRVPPHLVEAFIRATVCP